MRTLDLLLALIVVSVWGFNFVVIRIGLNDLPPILFTALRFLLAALPMVFFIRRPSVSWQLLASYALFQFVLQFTLLFSGIQLGLSAGLASLVVQLQAFFTIGLAVLLLGEKPDWYQSIGAVVAFSGVALVASQLEGQASLLGCVLVICAGGSWAAANIITKRIGKVNGLALVVWGSLLACPPLFLASLALEGVNTVTSALWALDWKTLGAVLFQSYPNTLLGFAIWSSLVRNYPAATIAPFTLLVPVAGMASASLVLGEALEWWKWIAGLLVIGGLALNLFGAYRRSGRSAKLT